MNSENITSLPIHWNGNQVLVKDHVLLNRALEGKRLKQLTGIPLGTSVHYAVLLNNLVTECCNSVVAVDMFTPPSLTMANFPKQRIIALRFSSAVTYDSCDSSPGSLHSLCSAWSPQFTVNVDSTMLNGTEILFHNCGDIQEAGMSIYLCNVAAAKKYVFRVHSETIEALSGGLGVQPLGLSESLDVFYLSYSPSTSLRSQHTESMIPTQTCGKNSGNTYAVTSSNGIAWIHISPAECEVVAGSVASLCLTGYAVLFTVNMELFYIYPVPPLPDSILVGVLSPNLLHQSVSAVGLFIKAHSESLMEKPNRDDVKDEGEQSLLKTKEEFCWYFPHSTDLYKSILKSHSRHSGSFYSAVERTEGLCAVWKTYLQFMLTDESCQPLSRMPLFLERALFYNLSDSSCTVPHRLTLEGMHSKHSPSTMHVVYFLYLWRHAILAAIRAILLVDSTVKNVLGPITNTFAVGMLHRASQVSSSYCVGEDSFKTSCSVILNAVNTPVFIIDSPRMIINDRTKTALPIAFTTMKKTERNDVLSWLVSRASSCVVLFAYGGLVSSKTTGALVRVVASFTAGQDGHRYMRGKLKESLPVFKKIKPNK